MALGRAPSQDLSFRHPPGVRPLLWGTLLGLVILVEGARDSVVGDAPVLAAAFRPGWSRQETRELRDDLETSTSWRVPANVELPGIMHIRTVTLSRQNPRELEGERQLWQLEVMYDRVNDAPNRKRPQPQR